uniref:Uncharacterized protein n=1 Tax=Opuntia streptacantha TaxID=393608 RepID=A0A7C8YYD6_OPUST
MRIRRSAASSVFPSPALSSSPSSCSSSSSCFSSSSTHTRSTISAHSLSSSSNSTSSSSSFSLIHRPRCQGLDLLVKAVYHVAGSVVGVPYIQKRVIRRRKRAVRFSNLVISSEKEEREFQNGEEGEVFDANTDEHKKQRRRSRPPSGKLGNRRRRRSKV